MFYLLLLLPLTLYFYNLNYFITIILLYQIYQILTFKENLTIEDDYQKSINIKNKSNGSLIYVTMKYKNNIFFRNVLKQIQDKLCDYNKKYNLEQDFDKIITYDNHYIFYNKKEFLQEENYHYKFFIDEKNLKIHAYIKHEYIGGSYLLTLFYSFLNTPQKNISNLFPKSSIFNLIFSAKLLYNYKNIPKIEDNFCEMVNDKNDIKRYVNNYILEKKQNYSSKTIIIYNILDFLYKNLNLNRPLVCYLPIAFQNYRNVKNNIGIMWITYDKNDSLESIDKKLYYSRYQIPATNALLLYKNNEKNTGSNIRKNVDAVITFMLGTENETFDVSWTFENISDYPIYVAIASIMKETYFDIYQTITSSTKNFIIDKENVNTLQHEKFQEVTLEDYKL